MPSKTSLVVDDATDSAKLLAKLLKVVGYDVQVAHDGQSALHLAAHGVPELVFLDIGLPDIDGSELAMQLRMQPRGQRATIVAVSGFAPPSSQQGIREMGFDHYVVKPVSIALIKQFAERFAGGESCAPNDGRQSHSSQSNLSTIGE